MRILLVEDEKLITATLADAIREAGYDVEVCSDGEEALEAARRRSFDVVVTDIRLPKLDGIQLFEHLKRMQPRPYVIFITAYTNLEDAVRLVKDGAEDYLGKPFPNEALIHRLRRIEDLLTLRAENTRLRARGELVGRSAAMERVLRMIDTVAPSDTTVLIQGESGTGKRLVAEALHAGSPRAPRPFFAISCSAIPETLIESELFGHVRGAFTDAKSDRIGRFEAARGGTVFLDDIDDLTPAVQVKLLRVLQEKKFERLGDSLPRTAEVRILAASKRDLWRLVQEGKFREDLYFRLNVVRIVIPPLRERPEDIPVLVGHFLRRYGKKGREWRLAPALLAALQAHPWPGNVRELEHAVERALLLAGPGEDLRIEHFFPEPPPVQEGMVGAMATLQEVTSQTEARHIRQVLHAVGCNRRRAAQILGISRKRLWLKMRQHGIDIPPGRKQP